MESRDEQPSTNKSSSHDSQKKRRAPEVLGALLAVAARIQGVVGSSVLIGGMAVSGWGAIRGTGDVDIATSLNSMNILDLLRGEGIEAQLQMGSIDDPIPWVISGRVDGILYQVLPPLAGIDPSRGIDMPELGIVIVDLKDLFRMKLFAGGPQDILDVARLVLIHPSLRDFALSEAQKRGCLSLLETFLTDKRTSRSLASSPP